MHDVALVGGMPSSGSTLLMRLLAERKGIACLPETGLFAHGGRLFGFDEPEADETDLGLRVPWLDTAAKLREALGVSGERLERAMAEHSDPFALARSLFDEPGCLLVEKTPENVFAFAAYLARDPEARVVVTTRSALGVTQSLMRRGFPMKEALLIWFAHGLAACELLRAHPDRVLHCSYATLTADPERAADRAADHLLAGRTFTGRCAGEHAALFERAYSELSMRAWTHSPLDPAVPREETNYLGNRFRLLRDRMRCATADGGRVSARWVEAVLEGNAPGPRPVDHGEVVPLDMTPASLLAQTLVAACRPAMAGR